MKTFLVDHLAVRVFSGRKELGLSAAEEVNHCVREILRQRDYVNIIFAAAPSQNELLSSLLRIIDFPWDRVNAFHMDEYVGLPADAPQSFGQFLRNGLFNHVDCHAVHFINGNATDIDQECTRYANLIQTYPPDIVCLGIGENTHLAFNDPHVADFNDPLVVKSVSLDEACRQQQVNDGCFGDLSEVPTTAITLTIPTLISGKNLFCSVPGLLKKNAVALTINHEVSEVYPSTILRKHKSAMLFVDQDSYGDSPKA